MRGVVITRSSLQAKLKPFENDYVLLVVSYTISCFVDIFLHFFENANYFHHISYFLTNILFHFENRLQK